MDWHYWRENHLILPRRIILVTEVQKVLDIYPLLTT